MPLIPMRDALAHARRNAYAIGYFESWDLESLLPVINAAEATDSPVIVGFNGGFIGSKERRKRIDIRMYGEIGGLIAERSRVPVCLLLNEAEDLSMLDEAIGCGFSAVMYDGKSESFDELVEINRTLVRKAHAHGVDVEAEVGSLPSAGIETKVSETGELTDPGRAAYFAGETGIDAVAISVGNVHLRETGKSRLNLDLIRLLCDNIDKPLVLHGGTGIDANDLRAAIDLGICKVNFGTILKRTFINSLRGYFSESDLEARDPHEMLGKGGKLDLMERAKSRLSEEIADLMTILNCKGKAGNRSPAAQQ